MKTSTRPGPGKGGGVFDIDQDPIDPLAVAGERQDDPFEEPVVAAARLEREQATARLRSLELQVVREVRDAALRLEQNRQRIETALRQTNGNQTKASAMLGLRVQTLNMKLKRFAEQGKEIKI